MRPKLLQYWQRAASDLRFQLMAPFCLLLSSGQKLNALFLVEQFGASKGMLIFGSYEEVEPYVDEIVHAGYGFAILDEPLDQEDYNKCDYIEILEDWGWSGNAEEKPSWLQ